MHTLGTECEIQAINYSQVLHITKRLLSNCSLDFNSFSVLDQRTLNPSIRLSYHYVCYESIIFLFDISLTGVIIAVLLISNFW